MQALVNDTEEKILYRKGNEHKVADILSIFKAPIIAEIYQKILAYYMEDFRKTLEKR